MLYIAQFYLLPISPLSQQSLGTMINLVEHCDINRRRFINASTITSFEQPGPTKQVSSLEGIIGVSLKQYFFVKRQVTHQNTGK